MPILNPSIQMYLLNKENAKASKNANNFYCRYLKIASRHIFTDLSTLEASITFKEDLKKCLSLIARKFGCQLSEIDLENPALDNIYKYLYNAICNTPDKVSKKSLKVEGNYFKLTDNFETTFFKPNVFYSLRHSWFLSDTPIAILTRLTAKLNLILLI